METRLEQKEPPRAITEEEPSIYEGDLADEMGVSRETIRAFRRDHLNDDFDWVKKNNRVFLTESAAERLKKKAGAEVAKGSPAPPPSTGAQGVLELSVVCIPRNVRMLDAKKKNGEVVRVRVRANSNFMPGMIIKARPGGEYPDVYVMEGRCPRWKGRW